MNILVLGGGGFIGLNLVEGLLKGKHVNNIVIFDKKKNIDKAHNIFGDKVDYIAGDFQEIKGYSWMLNEIDFVYHLICTTVPGASNEDVRADIVSNVISSVDLIELAVKARRPRIIFVSSGGTVYGRARYLPINEAHPTMPLCSYGISKLAIERYLYMYKELHGLPYTIFRLANPYGYYQNPNKKQGAISVFIQKALNKEQIEIWGCGDTTRDYIFITDAINALVKALYYTGDYSVFNLGSGVGSSLCQIVNMIENALATKLEVVYRNTRGFDVAENTLDVTRAKQSLHWNPRVPLFDGIVKTIRHQASRV